MFRAGAAAIDITPTRFPVIVNGQFHQRTAGRAYDPLMARALVLHDGTSSVAIVIVDNLMMPRDLLDEAKRMAQQATGIPIDRQLIAATHTHSAPSVMGCLGSEVDLEYRQWLPAQLARAIVLAHERLVPARIGWTVVEDHDHNHCRRWIYRPDRIQTDPFGNRTVRAHMQPGYQSPDHIGPAGPADPDLSLLAVQSLDGRPLAVLANYAMHYYGAEPISGDFCGRFGDKFAALIGATPGEPSFVGIMSQGTSGDSMWMDFSRPADRSNLDSYTEAVAGVASRAYQEIEYRDWVSLAMAETTLKLRRRTPDDERLRWAKAIVAGLGTRLPQGLHEIYAREQLYLDQEPEVELKLQAIRIGELGITAIPNEVYGITGLKLKARSPLPLTFNIELANGAEGYIPPPEQHALGGYTTWPARTAGLDVQAEPRIVSTLLELLEQISEKPRRESTQPQDGYVDAVIASRPAAYWRLGEIGGTRAEDITGGSHGSYEPGVAFYLTGPEGAGFSNSHRGNRAAHFAGGRMRAEVASLGDAYSIEFFFWNGLPCDARPITGYLFSRGTDGAPGSAGDHLGIGGTHRSDGTGKLILFNGNEKNQLLVGTTELRQKTWYHLVMTRDGESVRVYLNGNSRPEISGEAAIGYADGVKQLFLGGRSDSLFSFAGKIDEVAVYDRVLPPEEAAAHYQASGLSTGEPLGADAR